VLELAAVGGAAAVAHPRVANTNAARGTALLAAASALCAVRAPPAPRSRALRALRHEPVLPGFCTACFVWARGALHAPTRWWPARGRAWAGGVPAGVARGVGLGAAGPARARLGPLRPAGAVGATHAAAPCRGAVTPCHNYHVASPCPAPPHPALPRPASSRLASSSHASFRPLTLASLGELRFSIALPARRRLMMTSSCHAISSHHLTTFICPRSPPQLAAASVTIGHAVAAAGGAGGGGGAGPEGGRRPPQYALVFTCTTVASLALVTALQVRVRTIRGGPRGVWFTVCCARRAGRAAPPSRRTWPRHSSSRRRRGSPPGATSSRWVRSHRPLREHYRHRTASRIWYKVDARRCNARVVRPGPRWPSPTPSSPCCSPRAGGGGARGAAGACRSPGRRVQGDRTRVSTVMIVLQQNIPPKNQKAVWLLCARRHAYLGRILMFPSSPAGPHPAEQRVDRPRAHLDRRVLRRGERVHGARRVAQSASSRYL
jgi:hypothetical protein